MYILYLLVGWNDGKIRIYSPESGKLLFTINDAHNKVHILCTCNVPLTSSVCCDGTGSDSFGNSPRFKDNHQWWWGGAGEDLGGQQQGLHYDEGLEGAQRSSYLYQSAQE